jgi:hypothetical protein
MPTKSVTLNLADIVYIESNDTEVRIVTFSGFTDPIWSTSST